MCLIVIANRQHPQYRLIIAVNRDEYYQRPTAAAAFWADCPGVLAGRDLQQMGAWLGITRTGRFAALTNYRDPAAVLPSARSRGELVKNFLCGNKSASDYLRQVEQEGGCYNGFNLLVRDKSSLLYYSNRGGGIREIGSGVYGLSNHLLDTPWPKVLKAKAKMTEFVSQPGRQINCESLFAVLADARQAPDEDLPDTGVGMEWERALSPIFIATPDYGTRSSTVILEDYNGRVRFIERTASASQEASFEFTIV
jgi:uncharacterized protein with NRDE domain